jgi:Protein of unknown function (DUF3866)
MLALRRGTVVEAGDRLLVEVDGQRRPAWADEHLVGPCEVGDDVVVNVAAVELRLGSGGFDIVHVNLTRGLDTSPDPRAHVMKLNYTSEQHAVRPVSEGDFEREKGSPLAVTGVFFLHGQLPPIAWALNQLAPELHVGYVQTAGGALPGTLSQVVRDLRLRGLLGDHITVGPAYGGEHEAISMAEALRAARWDVALCGPGPGILGSASRYGHGGMAALDTAHTSLALGLDTVIVPRMSSGDPRLRHQGLSHHTETVLELLLEPVVVALPAGADVSIEGHEERREAADIEGYRESGLPSKTMGRTIDEDELFFAAALAGGAALAAFARKNRA